MSAIHIDGVLGEAAASAQARRQVAGSSTLPDLLDQSVSRFPDRPALEFCGRAWTYREVGALADRLAAGLARLGVGRGVRVGLCLPNTPYFVVFYFAVLKAGGTVVNFNPLYTSRECATQIRDSGTTVMVVSDIARIYDPVAAVADEAGLHHLVVCPLADVLPLGRGVLYRLFRRSETARVPADARHVRWARLVGRSGGSRTRATVRPDDVALLQYTGGTTGTPKGAMLTHANLAGNVAQLAPLVREAGLRDGRERVLAVIPLFHVFAMTVAMNLALKIGAQIILVPQFKIDQLLATIARTRPTFFPAVPTLFGAINKAAETATVDLGSIRLCISGGAPLPAEIAARFEALTGCRVSEGYGLTECSPVVCVNPFDARRRAGSVGLPLADTAIEIRDPRHPDRILPPGAKGEVFVRGPQVMAGYWRRPAETAEILLDGALKTGDIGYRDADGFLFLVDRIKDLILCGGYNVYPRQIEDALYEHEAVEEAVAIGIPDAYRGESPKAFVKLRAGHDTTPEALRVFLAARISKIELPREIEIRASLPKTAVGKLSKKELVAEERDRADRAALDRRASA
ncbi:long-chain fatty acid--CoA ligase [Methylobacterium mesophilicum SR1.6/6]|uniref:Long-chain fatty acid--CoA ligase n=1 Tax=Methylobacterium mesophilicum SR1.6/6 TaxID=908290 RepID=A0A6B9FMA2_9HYPH|nr:long-chain fatty acid--CoA ligase [Methylobacterium mesophilicum]QGY03751.1 long-chain fatty acid--CoA ligase [Methylobacterium mesophilicum SR1.6/6]